MFDIGFWELVVIGIVGLLVIGPDKLPGFVADVAKIFHKIKRFVRDTRRDLETELKIDEAKKLGDSLSTLDDLMQDAPDRRPGYKPLTPGNTPNKKSAGDLDGGNDHGC